MMVMLCAASDNDDEADDDDDSDQKQTCSNPEMCSNENDDASTSTTTTTSTMKSNTALAGRIWPLIVRVFNKVSFQEGWKIWIKISPSFHYQDLIAIILLGWCSVPCCTVLYNTFTMKILQSKRKGTENDNENEKQPSSQYQDFEQTNFFTVIYHLAQAIQLSLLVYCVDLMCLLYDAFEDQHHYHYHHDHHHHLDHHPDDSMYSGTAATTTTIATAMAIDVPLSFAKVVYTLWLAMVTAKAKHHVLVQYLPEWTTYDDDKRNNFDGLVALINHVVNAIIGGVAAMIIIDILELSGLGIRSAFALGSAGTLAITLGTQSLVHHIVSGFTMTTSNRFYVGDFVQLSKGGSSQVTFAGTVESLGWLETTIRGSNDQVTTIPNAQLEGIQVCNLSRNTMCQVKLTLHFKYQDATKLSTVLPSIKNEIIASCPKIISDGRRPCRVVWSDYCESYLEVIVDVHFDNMKPIGDEYWNNRQTVLMAIQRAVDSHNVQFAVMESIGRALLQHSSKG
jgi:small-conductance mechanosensitive channel